MDDPKTGVPDSLQRLTVTVKELRVEAEEIRSFTLVDPAGGALPEFTAGAHVTVFMPSGRNRQYSIANDPRERHRYLIAVQRETGGRGGSMEMHEIASAGAALQISKPVNNFPVSPVAKRHILIAGGIGITPIIAMAQALHASGAAWKLFYCARTPEKSAFGDMLSSPDYRERVAFHYDGGDPKKGLDLTGLLNAELATGAHVYCCGPRGLMEAVRSAGAGWPPERLHFEYFSVAQTAPTDKADDTFEVEIASSGQILQVPPSVSILSVLEANGIDVPSLCTEGVCGARAVGVLEEPRTIAIMSWTMNPGAAEQKMTVCCSRSKSPRLKLAL